MFHERLGRGACSRPSPGTVMDIPNIDGLSFTQADTLMKNTQDLYMEPAPLLSLRMQGCVETGRDISLGGRYNNYGFHGTGLSTAGDSLASIGHYVYEEGRYTGPTLRKMLEADFEGYERDSHLLRYKAPSLSTMTILPME